VGWDQENGELHSPEYEMTDHLLGGDSNGFRDVIWDVKIRRPNGSNDLSHCCGTGVGLDCVPEERGDGTNNNGESREIPPKGCTHRNGERNMESGTDHTIEDQRDSAYQAAKNDTDNRLSPVSENKSVLCLFPK
jgi:hypothetical protein